MAFRETHRHHRLHHTQKKKNTHSRTILGSWPALLARALDASSSPAVRGGAFALLAQVLRLCSLPRDQTPLSTADVLQPLLTVVTTDASTSVTDAGNGVQAAALAFLLSASRRPDVKSACVTELGYLEKLSAASGAALAALGAGRGPAAVDVEIAALIYQALASLLVPAAGKKAFAAMGAGAGAEGGDGGSGSADAVLRNPLLFSHPQLAKTGAQLVLEASEHPDIRESLAGAGGVEVVAGLKALVGAGEDEFTAKIAQRALDSIFWKP